MTPTLPLTMRQELILRYVVEHLEKWKFPPTYQEIRGHFAISYTRTRQQIGELVRKGYLGRGPPHSARSFTVLVPPQPRIA